MDNNSVYSKTKMWSKDVHVILQGQTAHFTAVSFIKFHLQN